MALRPIEDRVIVKAVKKEENKGGLFIPDTVNENTQTGEVIAVGPGKFEHGVFVPTGIAKGDKILFAKHQAIPLNHDGEEVHLLSPASILAVIND